VTRRRITIALAAYSAVMLAFLYAPIATVVVFSFNAGKRLIIWEGATLDTYTRSLTDPVITTAIQTSFQVALASTVVGAVFGSLAGYALARRSGRWAVGLVVIVVAVLVTPELVAAIAELIWFVRLEGILGLSPSIGRLIIAHSVYTTALVTLVVRARLAGSGPTLELAAADLGATPVRGFFDITVPAMLPAVVAGSLLAFTTSLDDVIMSSYLAGPGIFTLPAYVFASLGNGLSPTLAAVSTVMFVATLAALALVAFVLRRIDRGSQGIGETIARLT
jgi:ABC-type spermidine/putrescine transport system permease subunit II